MSKIQSKTKQKKEVQPVSEYKATVKVLGKLIHHQVNH